MSYNIYRRRLKRVQNPTIFRTEHYKRRLRHLTAKRRENLKSKYRITLRQFNEMLAAQGYCCKSCGDSAFTPQVDHCHKTGKVRGILCSRCNVALGIMEENPVKIKALGQYAENLFSLESLRKEDSREEEKKRPATSKGAFYE